MLLGELSELGECPQRFRRIVSRRRERHKRSTDLAEIMKVSSRRRLENSELY